MSASREKVVPLTRWQYFVKNLYRNGANEETFTYNKIIYNKSDALHEAEQKSMRINYLLILLLLLMFVLTSRYHNIWFVVGYLVLTVIGQAVRVFLLPRDITAHLEDSGYRER